MQCERCGTEFPEDATSCVKCGAPPPAAATVRADDPLTETEATVMAEEVLIEEPVPVSMPEAETTTASGGSGCGKACLWGVLGCAGVSLVMMCLCLVISVVGVNLLPSQFPVPMEEILGLAEEMNQTGGELPWEEIFGLAEGMTLEDAGFLIEEVDQLDPTAMSVSEVTPTYFPLSFPDVSYGNVNLAYPPGSGFVIEGDTVAALTEPEFWAIPEHVELTFMNYPLSDTFHYPRVMVFPLVEYEAMNSLAGELITELEDLLAEQPASPERIPFIPIWNAGPAFLSQVEYVDFQSGPGVRFISRYGQDAWPISNQELFYAYQGITEDGEFLVSAVLPISHPMLPPDGESALGEDYEGFIAGYEEYIQGIESDLNEADPTSFTPDLTVLDALMWSVSINR